MAPTTQDNWSADAYKKNAAFVPALSDSILSLLAPQPSDIILDIGCGDAVITNRLAQPADANANGFACQRVVGIDSSQSMISAASTSARALGLQNATYHVFDAQELPGSAFADASYTAVFSSAALHWMKRDPEAVVRGALACLQPGGRFVVELGGHMNIATIHAALIAAADRRGLDGRKRSPWYFPTVKEYEALLIKSGFDDVVVRTFARPTPLPGHMRDWLDTLSTAFFKGLDEGTVDEIKGEVCKELEPVLCDREGKWTADYVRIQARAIKKK
ncbi:hypothetical protein HK101_008367 [Irineochytrium annulatum]|nr:hypothetical protein HK101_008367 [Irineochytrium annulatum]